MVVIGGQFSSLSEAQWREITESLAKRGVDLDAETVSKLAEIPGVVIEELRAAIEAVCAQPTRSEMAKRLAAVRKTRQFDDTDPNARLD
jgi:DNA-directed RNA polymerase subunit F